MKYFKNRLVVLLKQLRHSCAMSHLKFKLLSYTQRMCTRVCPVFLLCCKTYTKNIKYAKKLIESLLFTFSRILITAVQ